MVPGSTDIEFSFQTSFSGTIDEKSKAEWIKKIISSEGKELGNLEFIFCSDSFLLKINKKYLQHDSYTDIITFDYVEGNVVSGEIYISLDRIKENATTYETSPIDELDRVISHGVLHLLGYNDTTQVQKDQIRAHEDYYLTLRP